MVNTYAAQSGGCRFESLWGFGFSLKGAYYEVGYCGKKTFLAGLQCTLTSSCAKKLKNERGPLHQVSAGPTWPKAVVVLVVSVVRKVDQSG